MNVIGHDDPRVQLIVSAPGAVFDRGKDLLSNGRLPEEGGSVTSLIEKPIQSSEGLTGSRLGGWKSPIARKAIV
jgi:hypothetical protein